MNILIDMCLPPSWVSSLEGAGYNVIHWKNIGAKNAPDTEIMEWARKNHYVVFTHDVDFGTMLALTNESGPSVIQVRTQDVTPEHLSVMIISYFQRYEQDLIVGALMVIDETRARVSLLPLDIKPSTYE